MTSISILFWSGGKDSLLALRELERHTNEIMLLTTYDESEHRVPHQEINLSRIREQVLSLGYPHLAVPLPYPCPNEVYLDRIAAQLELLPFEIECLAFGDWHLEDIKAWRREVFSGMGYKTLFPIWNAPLHELLDKLFREKCTIRISNVDERFSGEIQPGEIYDRKFIEKLQSQIDPMGENGEFHTEVVFPIEQQ